jgi:hypothetical protein
MKIGDCVTHRRQTWLRRCSVDSFFPASHDGEGLGRIVPEVIETEFFFQLLVSPLANPFAP